MNGDSVVGAFIFISCFLIIGFMAVTVQLFLKSFELVLIGWSIFTQFPFPTA